MKECFLKWERALNLRKLTDSRIIWLSIENGQTIVRLEKSYELPSSNKNWGSSVHTENILITSGNMWLSAKNY